MTLALSAKPPRIATWEGDLDTEDAKFMLRALEHDAYGAVVSAFRAQGPLTTYKTALLDHLRSALFVPVSRHRGEVGRATADPVLATIARRMNPLLDIYADWSAEASTTATIATPSQPLSATAPVSAAAKAAAAAADRIAEAARAFNRSQDISDEAFFRHLRETPKAPYVPEALRFMLKATAEQVTKIPSPAKLEPPTATATPLLPPAPAKVKGDKGGKRALKAAIKVALASASASGRDDDELRNYILEEASSSEPSSRSETPASLPPSLPESGGRKRKATTDPGTRCAKILTSPGGPRAKVLAPAEAKLHSPGKESASQCARCEPFIFPKPLPGGIKPPRGNPDKRVRKAPPIATSLATRHHHLPSLRGPQPSSFPPAVIRTQVHAASLGGGGEAESPLYIRREGQPMRRESDGGRYYVRPLAPPAVQPPPPTPSAALAAAYSSPTRPYYGNPSVSAAAIGVSLKTTASQPPTLAPLPHHNDKVLLLRQAHPPAATVATPCISIAQTGGVRQLSTINHHPPPPPQLNHTAATAVTASPISVAGVTPTTVVASQQPLLPPPPPVSVAAEPLRPQPPPNAQPLSLQPLAAATTGSTAEQGSLEKR